MTKPKEQMIRYIGLSDVRMITEDDWRQNQGITSEKGVPGRMVWWAGNNWTIPAKAGEDQLDDAILEYFTSDREFAVVDTDDTVHVPFIAAKKRTIQYGALQLGRAAAEEVDPVTAARHLSSEPPITHVGPAEVPGVTDTREEPPPTGRIPANPADASDEVAGAATTTRKK